MGTLTQPLPETKSSGHMTAAVLYGSEDLKIEKIDIPALAPDEVLVRVKVALTCGTDLKVWKRGYHARMITPPAVFGHELAGVIEQVGSEAAENWAVGARVVPANSAPCGVCFFCRKERSNLCEDLLFNNGAYAEYIRIPGRIVRQNMQEIPAHVSFIDAAMVEPLACVLRGIHETGVQPGDTTVLIGCGPLGLKFVRMLSCRGVNVIALGKRSSQVKAAERMGARAAFDVSSSSRSDRRGSPPDRRRPRSRFRDRGCGFSANVGLGVANGARRRHGESIRRLSARDARGSGPHGAALLGNQHQVHVSSHAALYSRSARGHRPRRNSSARFRQCGNPLARASLDVQAHEES